MSGYYNPPPRDDDEPQPKWYNWVGDPYWDLYCKYMLIFIIIPGGLFIGFCIWLIFTGRVV